MENLKPFSKERKKLREDWNLENEKTGISWQEFLINKSFKLEAKKLKK